MGRFFEGGFPEYVPVARRQASAAREVAKLRKQGRVVEPVVIEGRAIATTFWGKAWCETLESYHDFASRLPRGRSYARNGSVVDLRVGRGSVDALVNGSSLYTIRITIKPLEASRWDAMVTACAGKIDSAVELLRGQLTGGVMTALARREGGLFPGPTQVTMTCSCPDSAVMCKHVAAVLYGVGARLDTRPELLFVLRGVEHTALLAGAGNALPAAGKTTLASGDLGALFGIEIDAEEATAPPPAPQERQLRRADLLDLGVSAATIGSWLRSGVLRKTSARGVYATTSRSEAALGKALG